MGWDLERGWNLQCNKKSKDEQQTVLENVLLLLCATTETNPPREINQKKPMEIRWKSGQEGWCWVHENETTWIMQPVDCADVPENMGRRRASIQNLGRRQWPDGASVDEGGGVGGGV